MKLHLKKVVGTALTAIALCVGGQASAQRVAVKTNFVDWGTLAPNIGMETRLSRHLTLNTSISGAPFNVKVSGYEFKYLRFDPELRYYFTRPMARHFIAFSTTLGSIRWNRYDKSQSNYEGYEGAIMAVGASYGYCKPISKHWNIEAEIGVGWLYTSGWHGDKPGGIILTEHTCSNQLPVPIRLGVSLSYLFN